MMSRLYTLFFSLLLLCLHQLAVAQPQMSTRAAPTNTLSGGVTTQLLADHHTITPGQSFQLVWQASLPPGWHVYWQNPGDSGLPVAFDWDLPAGFDVANPRWPAPDVIEIPPFVNYGYYNKLYLPIEVTAPEALTATEPIQLAATAQFLYCKDVCLPAEVPLQTQVAIGSKAEPNTQLQEQLAAQTTSATLTLTFPANMPHTGRFIPAEEGWIEDAAPQVWSGRQLILQRDTWTATLPATLAGLWQQNKDTVYTLTDITVTEATPPLHEAGTTSSPHKSADIGLWLALGFALLAGLILNVMPCVLPVLSLKVMGLVTPGNRIKHTLAYILGILVTFWGLALALSLLPVAQAGWGFHLQSPAVVGGLAALLALMAFSFFGALPLPAFLQQTDYKLGNRHDAMGAFGSGLLMTLVATPCTVPFMGSAVAFALGAPTYQLFMVMTALGLGLAAPFAVLALWPQAHRLLPRSGHWNHILKVMLGLPLLATVIWLLFVLKTLLGLDARLLAGLLCLLIFLSYLAIQQALPAMPRTRWVAYSLLVLLLGCSLAVLPLQQAAQIQTEAPSDAQVWSPARVTEARAAGRPVFVNVTADWCITCKVIERTVLQTTAFKALLAETNTVYLVADWTRQDAAISALLAQFNHPGVPLYVVYPPAGNPQVLPQIPRFKDFAEALVIN